MNGTPYRVTLAGGEAFDIIVSGRTRWAASVHNLRKHGVAIETVHEKHGGKFAGTHARYVLRCKAAPVQIGGAE